MLFLAKKFFIIWIAFPVYPANEIKSPNFKKFGLQIKSNQIQADKIYKNAALL